MRYKKSIMLICMTICILFTISGVFANDALNETIAQSDSDSQELQVNVVDANITYLGANDGSSASTVYFDASVSVDGDGSKSNPYKTFKADRINYGTTAYFADGIYDIEPVSIHSSSAYKTTFIGQSLEKTILRSAQSANNKFGFTVSADSYFVLKNLTVIGIHINNQANLAADNVVFAYAKSFNPLNPPVLSYSYNYKKYNSTFGGVIICDTPSGKITTINLNNCQFINNSAVSGGVISAYNSIVDIQNCVFYNSTVPRFGGAIYAENSKINIYDSYFELNNAKYGGAVYADSSTLYLKDNLFNNSQSRSFGGVIASFSSDLEVIHSFFENYASLDDAGGAIYATRGTLKVSDSSFKNGRSDFGAAICSLKVDSTISNSEFINNVAQYYGGTIYNMYGDIVINKNQFINSRAGSGGSIFDRISDSFTLSNNNFVNSTANEGNIVFVDGKVSVDAKGNVYDNSYDFIIYGSVYDVDYYPAVPILNYTAEAIDGIPSSYDSRKYGYITPAKDQIQGGNCWAFAGISTLEACIKKATGIAYDFSEENVKNLMSEYSLFGLENEINAGGNLYMFIAYLAGWFGPIHDDLDIYDDFSSLSVIYDSIFHVQNVYVLPERETFFDNDAIKRAVMEYGAVSISIDLSETEGHAVTIVGWDDEFTSNDFLDNKAVGAWIIKNSWGTNWGYDGFGYLSYQQPINFGYTFIFDDDRGYTDIYQYDFAGKEGYHSISSSEVYLKNIFTAKNNEILSAFSTYFDEPTNFTASVYLNGNLVTTQSGFSEIGYYTIPFDKEVSLKKGDTFEIVVKFSNPAPVYIPLGSSAESSKFAFDKGLSYYSTDGVHWFDLYESKSQGVACIKAFTRLEKVTPVSIDGNQFSGDNPLGKIYVDDLVNIELDIPEYYVVDGVQFPLEGVVEFKINDQSYYATADHGKAHFDTKFDKEGVYYITIQYSSTRAISNPIQFKVNVEKGAESSVVIDAPDVSKFYGASDKYVATFTDDGKVLKGVNVKITVNGKEDYYQTDSNGQVILDLNSLPVGVYDIRAQYGGKVVTSKFTVLTTISVNDITQDFLDSYISASFVNTDGNALSNRDVSFNIGLYGVNSVPFVVNATTNAVGTATAKVNLYVDKYVVSVVNPVNGEKKEFLLEIAQIDSSCILAITQSGTTVTIRANVNPVQASGYVNFIISGNVYKANIVNGVATLRLNNLANGDYDVTAVYSSDVNLRVSSDTRSFSVTNNPYQLTSGNYRSYYGGSGTIAKIVDINNKDSNGNPIGIKGETVKATIANKTYYNTTDEDGMAWFNLDLDVGNYTVLFEYKGQSLLQYVFVYPTILMVDANGEYLNSELIAKVISPFDNVPLAGLGVKFIVNGKEYSATANNEGYASVKVDLPVGTHTVTTVNLVNGEKKESKVTVYKTTPTISVVNSKRGDTLILTATLTQSTAIGNVVFTMGSKKYTTAIKDGKAMIALNVLDEGSYEAHANYIGDTNFNNILSPTIKFDYAHTRYAITAPELTKYYGGSENFKMTLTNYGNPVSGAIVHLVIGGKSYDLKTDSKGIATFNENLNPGSHVLECSFEDAVKQSAINVESTIIINEGRGNVSYSTASAKILDANGNPAKNKVVTFKIGNNEYKQTTDASGVATLSPNLDKGTYTVTITNPVTGEVEYSTLIITKSTPKLTLSQVKVDGMDALKAVLPSTATGEIIFSLDGDEYSPELINGVSILEGVDSGEYNAVVNYKGDDNFNPTSASIKFIVSNVVSSTLMSSDVTTTYGTSKNIVVTLIDSDYEPLVGKTVTVNLNNKNYNAVIGSNGQAKVAIPATLAVKTYTATITYKGETGIAGDSIKVKVVVNKATPKLTAAKKTFKIKDKTKKYVVTLKTDKNKAYKNQKITIKVKGKTYSAKTNSKGQATFKLTKLTKKGTFKATVKYAGNSYYKAKTKTVTITVKK